VPPMRVRCSIALMLCQSLAAVHAAEPAAPLTIGETFMLQSKALGETRRINVYLPSGYAESADQRLPVLYIRPLRLGRSSQRATRVAVALRAHAAGEAFDDLPPRGAQSVSRSIQALSSQLCCARKAATVACSSREAP
jgi:hypothetical protein